MKKFLSLLLLTIFSSTLLLGCSGRTLQEGKTYTVKHLKGFVDETYGFGDLKDNFNQMYVQCIDYSEPWYNSFIKQADWLDDNDKIVIDIIKQYKKGRILCGHKVEVKTLLPKEKWDKIIKENAEYYDK